MPARVAGNWTVQVADEGDKGTMKLQLRQRYQKVEGQSTWDGASRPIADARLSGAKLRFAATDASGTVHRFEGTAQGAGRLSGTVTTNGAGPRPFQAKRQ